MNLQHFTVKKKKTYIRLNALLRERTKIEICPPSRHYWTRLVRGAQTKGLTAEDNYYGPAL